jgi:hypothetical protein
MVSAILTVQVFNARDVTIVPELTRPVFRDCSIQLADIAAAAAPGSSNTNTQNTSVVFNTAKTHPWSLMRET